MRNVLIIALALCSIAAEAVVPRPNTIPYQRTYTAKQTFTGGITATNLSDVIGDALCVTTLGVVGSCDDATFAGDVTIVGNVSAANLTSTGYTSTTGDVTSSGSGAVATTLAKSLSSNTNFVYDIDHDSNSTTEFFKITHNSGTVLFNLTENGAMFQKIETVQPTCNAAAGGAVITYIKGSGGTEATSKCACEEVAGVYAWTAMSATGDCT